MKRTLIAGAFLLSLTAFGQYPYGDRYGYRYGDRDDRYRDRDYRASVVDRVIADIDRVGYRSWGGRERDNAGDARNNLYRFQDRARQGRFDTKYLDRAIDHLKVVAYSGRTDLRARGILSRDIEDLRAFRASGGGYYRGY